MPKFLYTVIVLNILTWAYWIGMLLNATPDSSAKIIQFLLILGIAVTLTLSLVFYVILAKKSPNFTNLRYLYRKSLKISITISSGIVFYLGLRAFSVANLLNTILLFTIYSIILSSALRRR